ncbi:MAG: hypothetical protein ACOX9C_12170 [Kiritimatiellia bacterium]|jgi:hypothetical protein
MRTLRRLFWILVLLAIAAGVGLHVFVSSSRGKDLIAKRISQATGLKASVGDARLSGCKLALSDVKVWYAEEGDAAEKVVLAAPEAVVSRLDGRRKIFMARPVISGFQSDQRDWTPAGLRVFVDPDAVEKALATFSRSLAIWLEITEARIVLHDARGEALVTYSGVDWARLPVVIPGRPGLAYNQVVVQAINGESASILKKWLDDGRTSIALQDSATSLALVPDEVGQPAEESPAATPSAEASEAKTGTKAEPAAGEEQKAR